MIWIYVIILSHSLKVHCYNINDGNDGVLQTASWTSKGDRKQRRGVALWSLECQGGSRFGLGNTNGRGHILLEFAEFHDLPCSGKHPISPGNVTGSYMALDHQMIKPTTSSTTP